MFALDNLRRCTILGAQNTHPQCGQRAISDFLNDSKYGSLVTTPLVRPSMAPMPGLEAQVQ